jgi:hypothetical protein
MTLKEKFEQYAKEEVWRTRNYNAEECELIADEFAIGFAEWISYNYKFLLDKKGWFKNTYELEMGIFITSKELLEIYKKDKGL